VKFTGLRRDNVPSGVLGESNIIVVNEASIWVEDNVFKDGAELDSSVNVRLLLGGETNALGVAATLDVEDATVRPAVLVITDQLTVWISGKSGLAGAGKTEENGDVAILALVGRRVKGEDVVLDGHLIEEDGEDTLLHLTSVLGAEDNHLPLGEVDRNGCWGGHALGVSVCWERTGIVNGVVRLEMLKILWIWADEHVAHEKGVVGAGANDADLDLVRLVPSCEAVDDVDAISCVEVINSSLAVDLPDLSWHSRQSMIS
jgi:hypothetical protein